MIATQPSRPRSTSPADLEDVFRAQKGRVFAAAYRVTGSSQDAEDVLQTVFLRLLAQGDRLRLSDRPAAYLHRAAVNGALDLIRARNRRRTVDLGEVGPDQLETGQPDPERLESGRDLRRGLRFALSRLSRRSAEVFAMRYFEELSNKEIAEALGVTQTAVGVMLHRARKSVRDQISTFLGGTTDA